MPKHLTSMAEAMTTFMQILGSAKESLRKILLQGEFDEFPDAADMHCTARLAEMLNEFSEQLQSVKSIEYDDKKNKFLDEEMKVLEESKAIGIPNFLPKSAFLTLLQAKVKSVSAIPFGSVEKMWGYIEHVVVRVLLQHCNNYPQLVSCTRRAAQNLIAKKKQQSFDWMKDVVEMETLTDYTCNPEYTASWNKLMSEQEEFMERVKSTLSNYATTTRFGKVYIGHLRGLDGVVQEAFDLKMRMTAYWDIVLRRMVDNMALHLLFSVQKLVSKEMQGEIITELIGPQGNGLERMLEESPSVSDKRSKLKKSIGLLKEANDVVAKIIDRDYVDLDDEDDLPSNGIVTPPLVEGREQLGAHLMNSKPSSAGDLKLVKAHIQQEVKSPSGFASSELKGASTGERSNGITTPTSEEATLAALSAPLPPSVSVFDKPKQTNDPPAVFSFSSKVADKFPSLMPESSSRTPETTPESSSSLVNIPAPTGSPVKILELENGGHMKSLAAEDRNGKSDTIASASSNGPLVSSAPIGSSFTAASFNNANQIFPTGPAIFTPSTTVSMVVPSGTGDIASNSSILGLAATPTIFGGPGFKFGGSSDQPTEVSAASTKTIPAGDLKTKDSTTDSVGNGASQPQYTGCSSVVQNGVSQPQYKIAFRMSALEDYVDLDDEDDLPSNGIVTPPLGEGREQLGAHLMNSKPSSAGELKLVKAHIQQEVKSPSGFASSELKGASMGERSNGITTPTSEEATVAALSASPAPAFALGASPAAPSPSPVFPSSSSVLSAQPVFGNSTSGFTSSPGNNMAEDTVPANAPAPAVPIFGQPSVPPSPSGFMFGMAAPAPSPAQVNPFQFGGQQNQVAPQNPPPMFQASGSLEFNAGGGSSSSLGSNGGDKSGRKFVIVNRSKNRKK